MIAMSAITICTINIAISKQEMISIYSSSFSFCKIIITKNKKIINKTKKATNTKVFVALKLFCGLRL